MSTFVPWAMKDKQGNLTGFEIDVAKKLARIWALTSSLSPQHGPHYPGTVDR